MERTKKLAAEIGAELSFDDVWVVSNLPITLDKTRLDNLGPYNFARCNSLHEAREIIEACREAMQLQT